MPRRTVTQRERKRQGMTMVEVMVVAALSSVILLAASFIMSRNTSTYKKGADVLNAQLVLEQIIERMRSDVRALRTIDEKNCSEKQFVFTGIKDGKERKITYLFKDGTLGRDEQITGGATNHSDFRAPGKIRTLAFQWMKPPAKSPGGLSEPPYLCMVVEIISNEPGEGKATVLPFVCNFHPKCFETFPMPFAPK